MTHLRFFLSEKASHKGTVACAGGWNGPYVPLKRRTRSSETSGKMSIVVSRLATYSISVGKIPYRVAAGSAMALLSRGRQYSRLLQAGSVVLLAIGRVINIGRHSNPCGVRPEDLQSDIGVFLQNKLQ